MLERHPSHINVETDTTLHDLAAWIWHSHKWKETYPGYFTCQWCNKTTTSSQGITSNDPLCSKNPAILKTFSIP